MFSEKKLNQIARVRELAGLLGVDIFAHYYQRPEVKLVANYVGGSRGLFRLIQKTLNPTILLCGVNFMAETVARLRPELNVLIPRPDANCPYSETTRASVVWEIRRQDPTALIVADAKAPGAVKDLADALIPLDFDSSYFQDRAHNKRLYVLPGPNPLAQDPYAARLTEGVCQVHHQVELEAVLKAKAERPRALVAANVLCRDEVKARADKVGDSQALWDFCAQSEAKEFIVVAESGLSESLALTFSHKRFYDPGVEIFCPSMKLTNLRDLITALESYQLKAGVLTRFGARAVEGRLNRDLSG
ncbi:MAG: quinolinate synthase NadA [Deltaproteobacteria bacterium]|jgi:quinolinate synthase|nr:quinolinate synthase NadA [Deltaproteobacteria bacterium]